MADVIPHRPDGRRFREADRGQMLVVAGLVMAVSLVALVVLLNATIYSENLATRGVEGADREAADVRATAVGGVGELIDATNRAGPAPNETVVKGVEALDQRMARSYAERGGVVHLTTNESRITRGKYVTTDGNATKLANATNATTYTFAGGVDRTRRFTLEIELESLANTTRSNATDEAFHVAFNGSDLSESQEVYVYRNTTTDRVIVANATGGGDPTVRCEIDPGTDGEVTVDLTDERLDDTPCFGVWPSALFAPSATYTIDFGNADAAEGTATATVRPRPTGTDVDADHAGVSPAVYDATIDLRYRTANFRFETTVRVAPGEPRA
ncbi:MULTISPECIES: DUF7261 family protein [Haloferacaceae]|uniref:Flagellin n=1 Tax=Halorubrum glutamatedens TaxID=2707018 RepID=A0ABD5QVM5_9EURY|nr:hypothetical protein [Halobellus captivus]